MTGNFQKKQQLPFLQYQAARLAAIMAWALLLLLIAPNTLAQVTVETDEEEPVQEVKKVEKEEHSIKKATLYSAVLPGLGQAYNRKYWKIPIVYAGFGVMTYFIVTNVQEFREFKEAFVYKANDETYPIDNDYVDRYDLNQLETGMDTYRRYRDLSIIITVLWYGLNIIDANVDAHFFDYDMSEDLTLRVQPYQETYRPVLPVKNQIPEAGIRVTLNF